MRHVAVRAVLAAILLLFTLHAAFAANIILPSSSISGWSVGSNNISSTRAMTLNPFIETNSDAFGMRINFTYFEPDQQMTYTGYGGYFSVRDNGSGFGVIGVYGEGDNDNGGGAIGVQGFSLAGTGVYGLTNGGVGAGGQAQAGTGVFGLTSQGTGTLGISSFKGIGVEGDANQGIGGVFTSAFGMGLTSTSKTDTALYGKIISGSDKVNVSNASAVFGQNSGVYLVDANAGNRTSYAGYFIDNATKSGSNSLTNIGLYANATGGTVNYAAWFDSNVQVVGNLNVSAGKDICIFNGRCLSTVRDGTNGTNGINGTNGVNGINGTNGVNGINGTSVTILSVTSFGNGSYQWNFSSGLNFTTQNLNGLNGINGINGTNGVNGINGTNGVNGINGTNGINGSTTSNAGWLNTSTIVYLANNVTNVSINVSNLFVDTTNNRVGIGTSTPRQVLDVVGNATFTGMIQYKGNVTANIGGGALTLGACTSGTTTIGGANGSTVVWATPVNYPGDGINWKAYVSSNNTVTVKVCANVAGTPVASPYTVKVMT